MKYQTALSLAVLAAGGGWTSGQAPRLRIPVSGFVVDTRLHAIRPIQGLPGTALIGEPLVLPVRVRSAVFSRRGDFALVTDDSQPPRLLLVRGLQEGALFCQPLEEALATAGMVSLNESGTTAALVSRETRQLQFVSGLPDAPAVQPPLPLTGIAGEITALYVSVRGHRALLASSDGSAGGIYSADNLAGAGIRTLALAQHPVAVVGVNEDRDIVYADASAGEVVLIRNIDGNRQASVLLTTRDGLQSPAGLFASGDLLWVSNARFADSMPCGNMIQYDLGLERMTADIPLPVAPSRLESLIQPGLAVINALDPGPLYLFSSVDRSTAFVPSPVR